ncbi:MAG TPA: DNA polymerase III subunit delta [Gemmatimonadales bacterium]|nr:DNA polymerase III subunit delta [Gemmatimonadales bacterium]
MGALTLDTLSRGLKQGAPDPVYYLHGEEDVLKDEAVRLILDRAVDAAARDFNVDTRAAADLDAPGLASLVNTPPMLAERRAVVLRGVEQMRKKTRVRDELLRYLASPNPSTVLVLVQQGPDKPESDLAARATTVALHRLEPQRVAGWVAYYAKGLGLSLEPEATALLVDAVGGELAPLARELEKLRSAVGDRPATAADVSGLVGVRRGETLPDLVRAVVERRPADAARLVGAVLEQPGTSAVRMLSTLGTVLICLALTRAEADRGVPPARLAGAVKQHLFQIRPFGLGNWDEETERWARHIGRWSAADLRRALRLALAADRALKGSTVTDDRGILLDLVLAIAVPLQAAA